MKKEEFVKAVTDLVEEYIKNQSNYGDNAQLRVNPALLTVAIDTSNQFLEDLADSQEAIEEAAYVEGDESESAADYQVSENPDYYVMTALVKLVNGRLIANHTAIEHVAKEYFKS